MDKKRVVIVGGGFAGLCMANSLSDSYFDVTLIDKNNFHQFPPLLYQVATGGLDTASIAFPLRKILHRKRNVSFRMCELRGVDTAARTVDTDTGVLPYDYLVLATGSGNNFFGNAQIEQCAFPMKSLPEALALRNQIVSCLERAAVCEDSEERSRLLNFVIVGGGPTGVEVAGAIADMRNNMLGMDYPEIEASTMKITIVDGGGRVLAALSEDSSTDAHRFLTEMGVDIRLGMVVKSYDGKTVTLSDGGDIEASTLIWAAGVSGNLPIGIPESAVVRGRRIKVDRFNRVEGEDSVFAIGDISWLADDLSPNGYPQLGSVAQQQGSQLARNLRREAEGRQMVPFSYMDKGSMATIGRHRAVADIRGWHISGFLAWMAWMAVHLLLVRGHKNRIMIFIDWAWSYITFDASLRLLIRPYLHKEAKKE